MKKVRFSPSEEEYGSGDESQVQSQKANGASQAEQQRGAILLEATKVEYLQQYIEKRIIPVISE